MVTDAQLAGMLDDARRVESDIRIHVAQSRERAGECARGQAAYRHAVALRKALEDWTATRNYRAQTTRT